MLLRTASNAAVNSSPCGPARSGLPVTPPHAGVVELQDKRDFRRAGRRRGRPRRNVRRTRLGQSRRPLADVRTKRVVRGRAVSGCSYLAMPAGSLSSSTAVRDLPRATGKTGSADLPGKRVICVDQPLRGDHAVHTRHQRQSVVARLTSPNGDPPAVFLLGPYFSC